jgi:catalase-peroxidase
VPILGDMLRHTSTGAKSNAAWWPNQLNLGILHQQSSLSNPMGEQFDYARSSRASISMP